MKCNFILVLLFIPCITQAQRFSVLITEFLADPSPARGLPDAEFIELTNVSSQEINLINWKISDKSSTATIQNDILLSPGDVIILCPTSAASKFESFGRTIGLAGFPSLNNDADDIVLYDEKGNIIHAISYNLSWYKNPLKAEGGWSIEMIDTSLPCLGEENYKASEDESGGTPGKPNAVSQKLTDMQPPSVEHAYFKDSLTLIIRFTESIPYEYIHKDLIRLGDYAGSILKFENANLFLDEYIFHLSHPVTRNRIYQLTISELIDCAGNRSTNISVVSALPAPLTPGSIVINEILFNPPSGGSDYLELFNPTDTVFDLSQIYLANRSVTGEIQQVRKISEKTVLFFPGTFKLLTPDPEFVTSWYGVKYDKEIFITTPLPSFPDDKGVALLLDQFGSILDELDYSSKWHHPLLKDENGVSLEKIYPRSRNTKDNWVSAAASVKYGTPGYVNSSFRKEKSISATLETDPEIFSPDGDGYDDRVMIRYRTEKNESSGSILIYNRAGKVVKHILRNGILGSTGFYYWNGLSDENQKLPAGIYIIVLTIVTPDGSFGKVYKPVVIARKD